MNDFISMYQVPFLFGLSFFCFLLGLFVTVIKFHSTRRKKALFKIEMCVSLLLFSDALSYHFDGSQASNAYWIIRVVNFFLYFFTLASVYVLADYITSLYMESGKFLRLPKRLLLGHVLPGIGILLVIVSQFTGIYYSIDSSNTYVRGPLFIVSVAIPFIALALIFSFVLQYKNTINKGYVWSVVLFGILPFIASVIQIFIYGISFMNIATSIAAIVLFWYALGDQNEELAKAANSDHATGLPNSFGFMYEVDRTATIKDITEYNGFYFDIVRMNNINNKYGKEIGDEVIYKYAKYIREAIEKEEILGRLGGNFFVALIKKTNTDKFLDMLRDVPVTVLFDEKEVEIHVAAVAGVYEINRKNIPAALILGNCAQAVQYAKNVVHKPYVFMNQELEDQFEQTRILEENARKALANKEFEAYYQLKVNTATNQISGAEALVRWRKDGLLVLPFKFIPIMERNGSVCELDFYMLNCVCRDIKAWIDKGIDPVPVSINFSRKNLGNPILAEAIWKVVKSYDIPEDLIQIEVTETIDEFPLDYLIGVVKALKRYGLSVAIDDFGTGSSSIKLLKEVKFDVLKIDKTFIDYKDFKEKLLLQNIIGMASSIGLQIIAEGVEEKEKVQELKEMGCYEVQGYVFGKPVNRNEYEKLLLKKDFSNVVAN